MPKTYNVTVPIAGHAYITVKAENREEAIEKALNDITIEHIDEWDCLEAFIEGNVCYCPSPWEIEVECEDGDEEDG